MGYNRMKLAADKQGAPRQIKTTEREGEREKKSQDASAPENWAVKVLTRPGPEVGQDMAGQDVTLAGAGG